MTSVGHSVMPARGWQGLPETGTRNGPGDHSRPVPAVQITSAWQARAKIAGYSSVTTGRIIGQRLSEERRYSTRPTDSLVRWIR